MTLKEIIRLKIDRLDSIPDQFVGVTEKIQIKLLKEALDIISQMENMNGQLLSSLKNFQLIERLSTILQSSLSEGEYSQALHDYARELLRQGALTNQYYEMAFTDEFVFTPEYKIIQENAIKQTLSQFGTDAIQAQFIEPLKQQLGAVITSGSSMTEAIQNMTDYITGTPEVDGRLLRYVKQTAYDGFAIADRQYTTAVSNDLEAEWYLYEGGVLRDSRPFCVERHGHYYHIKEIEKWANLDWQGKRAGTNASTIFVFCGGYNCKHSLLPVSAKIVPLADIERVRAKGYLKAA